MSRLDYVVIIGTNSALPACNSIVAFRKMWKLGDIEAEYTRNKDLNKEDIILIKEWMEKQPHLPKISEFQIVLFLHSCYYRIEATKNCIESFYTARSDCPEFFANRDPIKYENEIFQSVLVAPLKKRTPEGYQIILCKIINGDASKFVMGNAVKVLDMVILLALHQLGTAPGFLILADLSDIPFGFVPKLYPTLLMKFFFYLQEALPVRLKGLLFFNVPSFMDKIMALCKPFIKNELMNSLRLYSNNFTEIYDIIPQACFPNDSGGEAGTIEELIKICKENLSANADFFVEDEKLTSDESKRVGKSKNDANIFGVDGTFKKLSID